MELQANAAEAVAGRPTEVDESATAAREARSASGIVAVGGDAIAAGIVAARVGTTGAGTRTIAAVAAAVKAVAGRFAAIVVALLAALSAVIALAAAPSPAASAAEPTDADSWTAVADTIDAELAEGARQYADGNMAGAASSFNTAYNTGYVASNFAKVVNDTIGADRYQSHRRQFQDLRSLAYQQDARELIDAQTAALVADLDECAATLDADADLADPRDYAQARSDRTAAERERLDAAKVNRNEGRGDRTWTDVADEMVAVLDEALAAAKDGDGERGAELVNEAYYQYYEKLGFEKNVMNAIGGDRVSLVENTFKESRKAMAAGEDASGHVADLEAMLVEDAAGLDGGAGGTTNGFTRFITSSFGQAFLILIREGLEALLVVAAIIAYLVKSGNRRLVKWIYLGVVAGLAGSGVVAAVFTVLFGGSGPQQEIMEGVCALVAMCMLLYTSNWMFSKSSVDAWNRYIRTKTEAAVARVGSVGRPSFDNVIDGASDSGAIPPVAGVAPSASGTASASTSATAAAADRLSVAGIASLAALSFLAVFREGAETVIFYQSIYSMTQDSAGMWAGGIAAAVVLVAIFLLFRFTSVRIPIRPFFIVTSVLLAVLVVIFAGGGVHSLIEGDLVGGTYLAGWPTNDWLGVYPYAETLIAQGAALVAVVALFAVGSVRQHRRNGPASRR